MRHKVKVRMPIKKRGFLGIKKTVMETHTVEVDDKTYKKLQRDHKSQPYTIEEMMLYDDIFFDD
ncbi:hypothetical protein FYJ79_08800 [Sharpea azabuensis]|uniref:Uncharacterized protein n=1 Tax=Sharpea porci TaxID=2652286 RepID=A0A844FVM6_9FIRM|nr:hypothetical protein [Sharpea porci]MST89665.1 hypothetical protein [Sharpea porci]